MKPEHLEGKSLNGSKINLDALYKIAPSCFTETRDPKTGELRHTINFTTLRELLGDDAVEGADEMYQFTWPGKQEARRDAASPTTETLRPAPEESVNWDTTKNLYIEGNNLPVLKLLQKGYMGKIKMMYFDPPYNTTHDFIYHDDFSHSQKTEDLLAGNIDEEGNRYRRNTDSNGRFHSDWCSMMYSRLLVAHTLLTNDGVIFIAIDEKEIRNLRNICDEIFGAVNHLGTLVLQTATDNNPSSIKIEHEYIVCYAKEKNNIPYWSAPSEKADKINDYYLQLKEKYGADIVSIQKDLRSWIKANEKDLQGVTHYDNVDSKGVFHDGDIANTKFGGYKYTVIHPTTGKPCKIPEKGFRFPESTMMDMIANNDIMFGTDETTLIKPKKRLEDCKDVLRSVIYEDGRSSTKKFESMMARDIFQNPKSDTIIQRLITFATKENDIILDIFSGSGTTAEATINSGLQIDKNKNCTIKNRRFIMVQINENLDESLKTAELKEKATLHNAINFLDSIKKPHTIPEIAKERIRRVGQGITLELGEKVKALDIGFRVLKLSDSNFKDVYFAPKDVSQESLDLYTDNIKPERSDMDLLFGAMLDWGVQLDMPMTTDTVDDCKVYTVNGGDLVACFAPKITEGVVKAIAAKKPLRVLFRDSCFDEDDSKINIFEDFKQMLDWSEEEAIKNIRVI